MTQAVAESLSGFWSENFEQQTPLIPWLWEGYLAPGHVTLLTSQWKSGKTTLLSILLSKLAQGGMLAGLALRPGRAVVVTEESAALWGLRHSRLHFQHTYFLCRPFKSKPTLNEWLGLLEHIGRLQSDHAMNLLVVDTLATFLPGRNEAAAGPVMEALLPLRQLTERGMSTILSHHPRKGELLPGQAARGSGAFAGFADFVMEMDWCAHPADPDRRRKILAFSRYDQTPRQRVIELNPEGTDYLVHGSFQDDEFLQSWDKVKVVLDEARNWATRQKILADWSADFDKPTLATLGRWLTRAAALGLILQQGTGSKSQPFRYALPGKEEEWMKDPMYELNKKFEESDRMVREMVEKPWLLGTKGR